MTWFKGSPGPWTLEDDGGITNACGSSIAVVQPHLDPATIAKTGEKFCHADGYLLAASWGLLTAFQWIVSAEMIDPAKLVEETRRVARESIAKALPPGV